MLQLSNVQRRFPIIFSSYWNTLFIICKRKGENNLQEQNTNFTFNSHSNLWFYCWKLFNDSDWCCLENSLNIEGSVRYPEVVAYFTSLTWRPGGKDCFNFSAFSLSKTTRVYKYLEQRILNFVLFSFFFILTARASFRRALMRKSFTSLISCGISN